MRPLRGSYITGSLAISAALIVGMSACGREENNRTEETVGSPVPTFITYSPSEEVSSAETTTVTETAAGEDSAIVPEEPGGSAEPDAKNCAALSRDEAAQLAVDRVPPADTVVPWSLELTDKENYDQCAPLSWITLGTRSTTSAGPYQIALFHVGEYIGTATKESRAFPPEVTRVNDHEISVNYRYLRDGESTATASGAMTAWFTWDDRTQSVVMTGEVPELP